MPSAGVIGIDGAPLGGKTYLAKRLRDELSIPLFRFDEYIPNNPAGRYADYLDTDRLGKDLTKALGTGGRILVEGTCLREVLDRIKIVPDFVIYCRNLNNHPDWIDFDLSENDFNSFVADEDQYEKYVDGSDGEYLAKDNARYHLNYRPVSSANEVIEWN